MADSNVPARFPGFRSPTYTQVPDELFDDLLPDLSGAELKVLLYITRRTFGFKREADAISLSQLLHGIETKDGRTLDRGTGLSKPTLLQALRSLTERNIIRPERRRSAEKGDEPTIYTLNIASPSTGDSQSDPVVKKLDQGVVKKSLPPVVKESAPQDTGKQETELSNIRKAMPENGREDRVFPASSPPAHTVSQGIEPIGTVLSRRPGKRTTAEREVRLAIESAIGEIAAEFNDRASLASSTSRALNLMREANLITPAFIATLYEARAITRDRVRDDSSSKGVRNTMGFFFAVLEDRLGLREKSDEPIDAPGTG